MAMILKISLDKQQTWMAHYNGAQFCYKINNRGKMDSELEQKYDKPLKTTLWTTTMQEP
jgi:hypothetical protein